MVILSPNVVYIGNYQKHAVVMVVVFSTTVHSTLLMFCIKLQSKVTNRTFHYTNMKYIQI